MESLQCLKMTNIYIYIYFNDCQYKQWFFQTVLDFFEIKKENVEHKGIREKLRYDYCGQVKTVVHDRHEYYKNINFETLFSVLTLFQFSRFSDIT